MKASQLIAALYELMSQHGDLNVAGELDAEDVGNVLAVNEQMETEDEPCGEREWIVKEFYLEAEKTK